MCLANLQALRSSESLVASIHNRLKGLVLRTSIQVSTDPHGYPHTSSSIGGTYMFNTNILAVRETMNPFGTAARDLE